MNYRIIGYALCVSWLWMVEAATPQNLLQAIAATFPPTRCLTESPNWPVSFRDLNETANQLAECAINKDNVKTLQEKWRITTDDAYQMGPVEANLSIVDGVIYFGDTKGSVFAADAETGQIIWRRLNIVSSRPKVFPGTLITNCAVGKKFVFFTDFLGSIFALDKATGGNVPGWPILAAPSGPITGVAVDDSLAMGGFYQFLDRYPGMYIVEEESFLFVSVNHLALTLQSPPAPPPPGPLGSGKVVAVDTNTGQIRWQFRTSLGSGLTAGGPGVGAFAGLLVDTSRGFLYVGTHPNEKLAGDPDPAITPIADSIIALNYRTTNSNGELVWHIQYTNDDIRSILVTFIPSFSIVQVGKGWTIGTDGIHRLNVAGKDIIGFGSFSGTYRAVDLDARQTLWSTVLTPPLINNLLKGINNGSCTACGVIYAIASFSTDGTPIEDHPYSNVMSGVFALRASDGFILWRRDFEGFAKAKSATANGVLFISLTTGTFYALDASNGNTLFSFNNDLGTGIPGFNALVGATTIYNHKVYLPIGAGLAAYDVDPLSPVGGIIAFGLPG